MPVLPPTSAALRVIGSGPPPPRRPPESRVPPKIAIATSSEYPALTPDDGPLLAALAARGVATEPVIWSADVPWSGFDGVLLRSVWDYYERPREFAAWLDRLEREQIPCWNPPALVRWNLDKNYLRDLASKGVAIVPTLWIARASRPSSDEVVSRILATGWDEVVLKPTISAGAWRTRRVRREDLPSHTAHVREVLAESDLMVQPFLPEIVDEGEYSFLFFDGRFSHAVLKRACADDFRVQWTHGGTQVPVTPSPSLVAQARAVLDAAPSPGLYARVDGIVSAGRLVLMELEQIEPYLYFAEGPGSLDRFADALVTRL
jgi:glutathione synthase/RimK-type ligase-like ATP-grasp enzyme